MISLRLLSTAATVVLVFTANITFAEPPPFSDYCQRLQQEIQGRKHGFLAGNVTYYVGGFHASWKLIEDETIGLTHPFHHDLRSRGVGLVKSRGHGHDDTGVGNDFSGWEFYKDTRVLYGSVVIGDQVHCHPAPKRMYWRPDRIVCEYEVGGVQVREEKFIAANDAACSVITSSRPVILQFDGQSFWGRHSQTSTATIEYSADHDAIHIVEGGTTLCRPETDRDQQVGPIMYQGMSTVLSASRSFADSYEFQQGKHGEQRYEFKVPCDSDGVVVVWAMHDQSAQALNIAMELLGRRDQSAPHNEISKRRVNATTAARTLMLAKTRDINRQLNEEIPWFRCSDKMFEDIYYYLWSLYLMYYIDVQQGWEIEPHTQTAVNNFLGMHRYDAAFQIKVGAWTANKPHYAYGNVLTWKRLFENGHYRKSTDGVISLADNKGTTWHSGVYGNELSEHVLGAWQIYQHTGDIEFLRNCYEGYFREVFRERIAPFFSNQFEVVEALIAMAYVTGHDTDIERWQRLVSLEPDKIRNWFDQRWQINGHTNFFNGPRDGMLMTTGFWHMRSKYFPREYAVKSTAAWALDKDKGFYGAPSCPFPLAMSRQAMKTFKSQSDHAFGYTPDTAYFALSGMFRQQLGDSAWRLTLNHLARYNFNDDWNIPVAPEAYTREGKLFGDQYSNFNAGKLLLYLEGLAGLEYSVPENKLVVHDTMPKSWTWMEVRLPIQMPNEKNTRWPGIRYERSQKDVKVEKSIRVTDCPLAISIELWPEGKHRVDWHSHPATNRKQVSVDPNCVRYQFDDDQSSAYVKVTLDPDESTE